MVSSGVITVIVIAGLIFFVFFSSWNRKSREKKNIGRFKDMVREYIYEQKILNPFIIYKDVEDSKVVPREVLRKLNAFDYIDAEVKKAKAEMRD